MTSYRYFYSSPSAFLSCVWAAVILIPSICQVPSICQAQDGARGQNGDPATDGRNGASQQPLDFQVQDTSTFVIQADDGGMGGHGGTGVDGPDSNQVAQGGNGGNGGQGAALHVWNLATDAGRVRTGLIARGGSGGDGGQGGSSVGVPNGQGGNGGDASTITTEVIFQRSSTIHGIAGIGGDAFGYQKQAGRGGDVVFQNSFFNSPFLSPLRTIYYQQFAYGGGGGFGRALASGGDGGDVIVAASSPMLIQSGEPLLYDQLHGGRGGDTLGGLAGNGGHVTWQPRSIELGAIPSEGDSSFLSRYVMHGTGGNGGNSFLFNGRSQAAGNGGEVTVESSPEHSLQANGGQFLWQGQWQGGNGGRSNDRGDAGHGGNVQIDLLNVSTTGSVPNAQQSLRQQLYLRGGDGGNSIAGRGGNGGNSRTDATEQKVSSAGTTEIDVVSVAGNGGTGTIGGNGGTAYHGGSSLEPQMFAGPVEANYRMYGGYGGNEAQGGGGYIDADLKAIGDITVNALALGGQSANGVAGGGGGELFVRSEGDENSVATVNLQMGVRSNRGQASRIGGSAYGAAVAVNVNGRQAISNVSAKAGYGTEGSGEARSLAIALNQAQGGNSISYADASTMRVGAENPLYRQRAYASAESYAEFGTGTATSLATAYGANSLAAADSRLQATTGTVTATAISLAPAESYSARVVTSAERVAHDTSHSTAIGSEVYYKRILNGLQVSNASALLSVSGGMESMRSFTGFHSDYDLNDPDNVVFSNLELSTYAPIFNSDMEITQQIQASETANPLSVVFYRSGVFDFNIDGQLDLLLTINDQIVMDRTWTNLELAAAELDHLILDLDQPLVAGEMLSTNLQVSLNNDPTVGSFFRFHMGVVGFARTTSSFTDGGPNSFRAVPEPNSAWLLGGLGILLIQHRRRNGNGH